jgi:hypothetical protein
MSAMASPRDPRRSLIIGSVIAAIVLLALAAVVVVGLLLVFVPRRSARDSLGPVIHPMAAVAS